MPNKGELFKPTVEILGSCGINVREGRSLTQESGGIKIFLMNVLDIPMVVDKKFVDFGITGEDCLFEYLVSIGSDGERLSSSRLGFGACDLVVAASNSDKPVVFDSGFLVGLITRANPLRVATKYVNMAKFFLKRNLRPNDGFVSNFEITKLNGSVESSIGLGIADAIIDIVSTGTTLRANGLFEVRTVLESEAVLIQKRGE